MRARFILSSSLAAGLALYAAPALAQQLELPRPSPSAKVSQTVGLTEVTVEYSSPAVKGRKVFGGLVPLGELWRTGANAATKITFSKDVTIADKPVPAGSYALFTIPGAAKDGWTVILNKNPNQGGTGQYKQDLDLLRTTVKPQTIPLRERLTFLFSNTTESTTSLDLEWETTRVALPIKANTDAQVAQNIKGLEENSWRPYNNAARYLLESKKDPEQAMRLVDRSLSLREDWLNVWTKAQLLAQKNKAEACTLAQKAKALGDKSEQFFFADDVKKALAEWKCK
jgi:hypothetical protein